MNRSVIDSEHRRAGALFGFIGDWEMPQSYGAMEEEYRALRSSVGLCDCSHWGRIFISGRDRGKFLHNLTTNEVLSLKEGEGSYNAILNPKGRMLASFWVHVLKDSLLLEIENQSPEKLIELFLKYKFFSDIRLVDATKTWGTLFLAGPHAPAVARAALGIDFPALAPGGYFTGELEGEPIFFVNRPLTGEPEFAIHTPARELGALWARLMQLGAPSVIRPVGQEALEVLRIEAGIPRFGVDMDDFIIPVEAGLEQRAISYTKGCYVGQEVIARIKTYGHVNKHLVGLKIEGNGIPPRESKVFDGGGKEVGWVTSAAYSPGLGRTIALGYIRPQVSTGGTLLSIQADGEHYKAEVSSLPFSRGSSPRTPAGVS